LFVVFASLACAVAPWARAQDDGAQVKNTMKAAFAAAEAGDDAALRRALHRRCAFWDRATETAIGKDNSSAVRTALVPPKGYTAGDYEPQVEGDIAIVSAPFEPPAKSANAPAMTFDGVLVREAGRWQIVLGAWTLPDAQEPVWPGEVTTVPPDGEPARMRQAFRAFALRVISLLTGADRGFFAEAAALNGAYVEASGFSGRPRVATIQERENALDEGPEAKYALARIPVVRVAVGAGEVVGGVTLTKTVNEGQPAPIREMLFIGYSPKDGKWRAFGVAAIPLHQ
jgi:hypothetical protein